MQAVQKAIHLAEGRKTRPINPKEAAKGSLDYVQVIAIALLPEKVKFWWSLQADGPFLPMQVKDWGSGSPEDLDKLQVESVSSDNVADTGQPFSELLARQLQQLEASDEHLPGPARSLPLASLSSSQQVQKQGLFRKLAGLLTQCIFCEQWPVSSRPGEL